MLNLRRFEFITFDCYGTLIDWESGILEALRPFRERNGLDVGDADILAQYAELESQLEAGEYRRYRDVLRGVMRGLAVRHGVGADNVDVDALVESLPRWRPFPDTVEALERLHRHVRLGIISNTDEDLFSQTACRLAVKFDVVVTAGQVQSYKPAQRNFLAALDRIGIPRERLLHAAQSRYHDVAPAHALGIATVWVNRRGDRSGGGATPVADAVPDLEVPDLKTLADRWDEA